MQHHAIKIEKTAHIYTLGTVSKKTKYLWFVTHGYGQLASNIIHKFEHFDNEQHVIIAPEALNRFYWDMHKGIVGASWMTKQDRLDEIDDYCRFLSQIYDQYTKQLDNNCQIIFLGFSQGTATLLRWILRGMPRFNHLIMWGGILPEDLDYQPFIPYFDNKKLHFICGNEDEFVTQKHLDWNLDFAQQQGLNLNYHPFEGKHEILTDVLNAFFINNIG